MTGVWPRELRGQINKARGFRALQICINFSTCQIFLLAIGCDEARFLAQIS